MISIIITAKKEPKTIKKAVWAFALENSEDKEIIVVAPDEETLSLAREVSGNIRTIKDKGRGKPAALNLAMAEAKGDKIIFSDGDVEIGADAVKYLLTAEGDLISGRPVADQTKNNMFGFWQRVLFGTVHELRQKKSEQREYFPVSGYLFLAKRKVFQDFVFPEESLAEDDFLSHYAWQQGFKIYYESQAEVRVKGPENLDDWVKQKIRTLGASYQIPKEWKRGAEGRSFGQEAGGAIKIWINYGKSIKEKFWLLFLFFARFYAWFLALVKIRILGQKRDKIWQRVESTK